MYVLSRNEMYFYDKFTMEKIEIPSEVLMENAGRGCSEYLRKNLLLPEANVIIFCGSGNNGGDGFVIARYLKEWGFYPNLVLLGKKEKMSVETLENFRKCKEMHININQINSEQDWKESSVKLSEFEYVIDSIFGIGFRGKIEGWRREIIKNINNAEAIKIAIDIASGIDADTGSAELAVEADYTLAMAAPKYGHYLLPGRIKTGQLQIIDIGIPNTLYKEYPPKAKLMTENNVHYPLRNKFYHKGHYGKVGIIAGSPGFSGAAVMAAKAALRAGSGLVTLFHPNGMEQIFETQLLEVMTYALPKWNKDFKSSDGFEEFKQKLFSMDVLLVGPGLGVNPATENLVKFILKNWEKPLIIDADGLNIISKQIELLKTKNNKILLTPHIGEFCRLTNLQKVEIQNNIMQALDDFQKKYNVKILLKSCTTIYSDRNQKIFNTSGNDALATGGSGDVLAGIVSSFIGQKLTLAQAAGAASYLLGKTAEKISQTRYKASIIPSDIIENLFNY
ncbi:MAG: NAD(P)H-hydrate dehydratase [Candidatus Cloacimonadota bacterium]|nr:NAD(P)H-hydrate dehydratase [Candidatus Cloacimonadota bacterium]